MAQDVQIIDIRRSYVPIDPNAFPVTMLDAQGEDSPETRVPVVPYDGYNFMPTPQGYASYFGINSSLAVNTLVASGGTGNVDDIFMIQTLTLDNVLVALCDDGIWTKSTTVGGNWTHAITLAVPPVGQHLQWSKCVLENEIIAYRQADVGHYKAGPANSYVFTLEIPTFINMAGQLGIFKAGGRLGYWDSENSISWSGLGFTQDFIPDLESLAGNTIFQDIVGKIVVCLAHGTGFIVYCTKSIVAVSRNVGSPMLWQGKSLFNNNGISYREEVCVGEPDITHFAFTTQGIAQISGQITASGSSIANGEFISPEVATYLKEKRQPVYLQLLNGRYLFFKVLDPYYMNGGIAFHQENIPPNIYTFGSAVMVIDGFVDGSSGGNAGQSMGAVEASFDTYWIKKHLNKDRYEDANTPSSVPIWEDHLSTVIPVPTLNVYKTFGVAGVGSPDFFTAAAFGTGLVPRIDGKPDEAFIPAANRSLVLVAGYAPSMTVEPNENSFWNKQDWLWYYERGYFDHWKRAIQDKVHEDAQIIDSANFTELPSVGTIETNEPDKVHKFGPYIDVSYFSEYNKYYGNTDNSAWVQRSLTKGVVVEVNERSSTREQHGEVALWICAEINTQGSGSMQAPKTICTSYLDLMSKLTTTIIADIYVANPSLTPGDVSFVGVTFEGGVGDGQQQSRYVQVAYDFGTSDLWQLDFTPFIQLDDPTKLVETSPLNPTVLTIGGKKYAGGYIVHTVYPMNEVFTVKKSKFQAFDMPTFKTVEYPPCTIKNLGYTKIKGHGHYSQFGVFIEDDTIGAAVDYQDQCLPQPPKKKKHPEYNSITISNEGFPGFGTPAIIQGTTYTFPLNISSLTIPGGQILLQAGSIEPTYPTLLGAFVFDIHYKKWGKMNQMHKRLLDYFPINDVAGDGVVPYDVFLPRGALLHEDGLVYLFDQYPSDSFITYGKVGFYRKGFTQSEEVRIVNRAVYSGSVQIEASITSGDINPSLTISRPYIAAKEFVAYAAQSGRWYNVTIEGNYDLMHLEFRGHRTGRR